MSERRDKFWQWLAFKMPKALIYFCGIRLWAWATSKQWEDQDATTVTMDQCLDRWDNLRIPHDRP